ncbi:MAG TPA: serpin family protein [Chthoniobacteraceae bacterium]|nr:serpin family protein [Chthoniobacteraceae bacterium]
MKIRSFALLLCFTFVVAQLHAADTTTPAAEAVNAFGIDLFAKAKKPGENTLISPYSIQVALAMTYAGAAGKTREEMQKTLHYIDDDAQLNAAFASLESEMEALHDESVKAPSSAEPNPPQPITLNVTDRLFGQTGGKFKEPFLAVAKESYKAPLEEVDFAADPEAARKHINAWVDEKTVKRIPDLIPPRGIPPDTVLVLVNAIYLKASWEHGFAASNTGAGPFYIDGGEAADVPMMNQSQMHVGFEQREGYSALAIPYIGSRLQFLVLLPDKADGLPALEAKLTPELLAGCAKLTPDKADISMPKFKIHAPTIDLKEQLEALGMPSAFGGDANFSRMSAEPLRISHVFHQTFLSLDENGTEAAAATAVVMSKGIGGVFLKIDHPFLFAIQDSKTGVCLFLGHVTDPR